MTVGFQTIKKLYRLYLLLGLLKINNIDEYIKYINIKVQFIY